MPAKRIVSRMVLLALLVALAIPFAQSASAHGPGHGHGPTPPAPAPAHLRIGVFARSIPAIAAVNKGFYADYNITVEYLQVSSSTQQFQYLRDDLYDIVMTSPDNVANYRLNSSNALGATIDQVGFLGLDAAQKLALVARPGISSPSDLAGKVIAVDSPNSGFAYVIYDILASYGLERNVDYTVLPVGGVSLRYQGLLNGDFDATLLSNGFETRAENAGYPLFDTVGDIADPYLGLVAAAKSSWLNANEDVALRFSKAYIKAVRWSLDPANRDEAVQMLMSNQNISQSLAEQYYDIQVDPATGNIAEGAIDREALYNVLVLRNKYNGFDQTQNLRRLSNPGTLYTLDIQRKAIRELRHESHPGPGNGGPGNGGPGNGGPGNGGPGNGGPGNGGPGNGGPGNGGPGNGGPGNGGPGNGGPGNGGPGNGGPGNGGPGHGPGRP
jgi:ABC-type nitrate/sulfonate/bicarbonate transport system substrate-binding protein